MVYTPEFSGQSVSDNVILEILKIGVRVLIIESGTSVQFRFVFSLLLRPTVQTFLTVVFGT